MGGYCLSTLRRHAGAGLLALGLAAPHPALAKISGDAKLGAKQFIQCRACHTVDRGGRNGVGPNLYGIVGAKAAKQQGFRFSPALTASKLSWTPETLDAWLQRPSKLVPGNTMVFAGMPNPAARGNVIAYLATLEDK